MKKYIRAEIQNMAQEEILSMIPKDTIERIKKNESSPVFNCYCIGHEGTANAQEISFGKKMVKAFNYVKDMIVQLGHKLQLGTAIFIAHKDTNEHKGREQIGEVIGKTVKYVNDKLSALAAVYIYPQYRQLNLDVASIEAEMVYMQGDNNSADVIEVDKVTAIALDSSDVAQPAFKGATLLGIVQAFAKEGDEPMKTKEEIIAAIKENKFNITDIFTPDDIVDSEPAKQSRQKEYAHAKRIEEQLGQEHEKVIDLTKKNEDLTKQVGSLNEAVNSTQVKDLFGKSVETRKLDDKQKAFIEKHIGGFKSSKTGEELKTDFERFMDGQMKDFEDYAKIMGIDVKKSADGKAGAPSSDGKGGGDDLSNPKNNDLIPQEAEA